MSTYAIIGASGKVGFATSSALRHAGASVRAILRNESKAALLRSIGCEIAIADLSDADSLAKAINHADAVQIILPPAFDAEDPAEEMRAMMESAARAIEEAKPRKLLAISDYGAHVLHDIGLPSMFRLFEERLARLDCEKVFLRSAEHMQNWARVIQPAKESGLLPTFHESVDRPLATISAPDLGHIAAELLLLCEGGESTKVVHAEGPRRYTDNEVAAAFTEVLDKPVSLQPVPRTQWDDVLGGRFPRSLAELLIKTNDAQNEGGLIDVQPGSSEVRYGTTEFKDALQVVVRRSEL